ncbi:MAG: hypothetical protein KIS87_05380, partial [Phycisphaeraceae bacterium]|nr:hypothetical protein [Phycisphaeraceae bacterium]
MRLTREGSRVRVPARPFTRRHARRPPLNPLDLAYLLVAGATAPWWARKARGGWRERFARDLPPPRADASRPRVLVHAVSVGEVNAVREFVPTLAERTEVVVAASTDTGIARARELFADRHLVVRYPLDASGAVRRFLDAVRPDAVALVELELWPNFVRECVRRAIPVGVVNGRLSDRSFRGYRRIRPFIGASFRSLAFAGVQDETYAERFRAMGTPPDRVHVTGAMKFDAARVGEPEGADALAREMGIDRT